MSGLVLLILAFSALTALAIYLDRAWSATKDPREVVKRAHEWGQS